MSRIFVRNIPTKLKQSELEFQFSKVGKITDLVLKTNFAFIQYGEEKQALEALRLFHDTSLQGNKLVVELAKTRTEKLAERLNEKCFKCGDFGHWAKDCKIQKRQKRQEKRKFSRIRRSPKRSFSRSLSRSSSSSRSRSRSRNNRSRSRSR
jgi:arginine/serine-rich splicing factor 7